MNLKQLATIVAACAALTGSATQAFSQQWPTRSVKVVVPYGAGGVTDTMARLTADRLTKALGQSFVIENKVGAGGAIGIDYAMSLPRDGYTILFVGSTLFTVLPLAQKVNYEPLKDLIPVSITGTNGMVMVVPRICRSRRSRSSWTTRAPTPARSPIRPAARPPTTIWRPPISPAVRSSTWSTCRSRADSPR